MNKIFTGIACFVLLASSSLTSPAWAGSRSTSKGEKLEQQTQQLENQAQQQEAEGHGLRAGRDARRAARKGARAERKLKKGGAEQPGQTTTTPAQ